MRRALIAAAALTLTCIAAPAAAFVVEVTTSIPVDGLDDEAQLQDALQSAVDSVLSDAIAFRPTVVVLTHAIVKAGRLYVRLLVADREGEQTFDDLHDDRAPDSPEIRI